MYGNIPSAVICNILLYSVRVLLYSARVGLYGVGGMRWERVVVYKVLRGGPVTILLVLLLLVIPVLIYILLMSLLKLLL